MKDRVETGLSRLRGAPLDCSLDRLEDDVWARIDAQARADIFRGKAMAIQVAVTCAALILGLAIAEWTSRDTLPASTFSEIAVLSDDGALIPSVRLGGGA